MSLCASKTFSSLDKNVFIVFALSSDDLKRTGFGTRPDH